ncbi:MAG: hypothetical protein ABIG43_00685 [Chloroflexota bacterium]
MKSRKFIKKLPLLVGLIFLLFSAILLVWRLLPSERLEQKLTIPAGLLSASPEDLALATQQDISLCLRWPKQIKAGDTGEVWLRISPGEVLESIPANEDYQVVISSELVMIGLDQSPQGEIQTAFDVSRATTLTWQLQGDIESEYQGTLWVNLDFVDKSGKTIEVPIAALDIQSELKSLWGLNTISATWLGMLGFLFWGLMMVWGVKMEHSA